MNEQIQLHDKTKISSAEMVESKTVKIISEEVITLQQLNDVNVISEEMITLEQLKSFESTDNDFSGHYDNVDEIEDDDEIDIPDHLQHLIEVHNVTGDEMEEGFCMEEEVVLEKLPADSNATGEERAVFLNSIFPSEVSLIHLPPFNPILI
jgi:hypothetical protein